MAALFALDRNLVVRFGNVTYQFNRKLDNGQIVQFENQHTGEYKTFGLADFYSKVQTGVLIPVLGVPDDCLLNDQGKPKERVLDLSALPTIVKTGLEFRSALIRYMRKKSIRRGQRSKIAQGILDFFSLQEKKSALPVFLPTKRPSASVVMGWMRRYEESGRNMASLLSGNTERKRETTIHPEVEKAMIVAIDKWYLIRGMPSLQNAFDRLQTELKSLAEKSMVPVEQAKVSFATFQRRKDELDPYMVATRRYGQVAAAHKLRVTMDGTIMTRAMQRYEVDHTPLNWVVICDRSGIPLGRPTLTVIIDSYSGYVAGMYVSFNGAGLTSVINVLKNAIRPKDDLVIAAGAEHAWIAYGVPDCLLMDNGMEFHSYALKLIGWDLGIDLEYCKVRTPWLKPKVERFFANLDFLTLSAGRVFKPMANVQHIDPKKDAAIILSELCRGLVLFCCDINNQKSNSRTLELPFDRFVQSMERNPAPSLPTSMAGLDMIAAMSKSAMVAQGGVEFYGLSYAGFPLKELIDSAGGKFKTLIKWDPDDLGDMYVQHPRNQEWVSLPCTRQDYARGLTYNQHTLLKRFTRQDIKKSGHVDDFLRSKDRLSQIWQEPLARKNKTLDQKAAKNYAGKVTNSLGYVQQDISTPSSQIAARLVVEKDLVFDANEIPNFSTYRM
jgi:putative transposase